MKNKTRIIILLIFIGIILPLAITSAAGLVPCGDGNDPSNACTLCDLIIGIYEIIGWLRNILVTVAFVAIFIAGIMYVISSGDEEMMKRAKGFLSTSLIGFTIVLCAWLIVNTTMWALSANDDLGIGRQNWYTFTCETKAVQGTSYPTPQTTGQQPISPKTTELLSDSTARKQLISAGISVSSSGNCSDQNNPKCTSLEGLPQRAIDNLIAIKNTCGISPTITAGTEVGHQSHGSGQPIVDLRWDTNLANCIKNNASLFNVKAVCTTAQDKAYSVNCSYDENNQHIHIAFN